MSILIVLLVNKFLNLNAMKKFKAQLREKLVKWNEILKIYAKASSYAIHR